MHLFAVGKGIAYLVVMYYCPPQGLRDVVVAQRLANVPRIRIFDGFKFFVGHKSLQKSLESASLLNLA
jgi:hypothetical protein